MRFVETALAAMAFLLVSSCSSKPSSSSTGCRVNPDCAAGSICKQGKCTPGCQVSGDCPTGQSCEQGACVDSGADGGTDASSGGTGGTGGASGGAGGSGSELGNVCSSDSDCGAGLHCALPTGNDFGFAGASRGYCTVKCTSTSDCSALYPGSQCVNYGFGVRLCIRGCDHSKGGQCFNRYDVICMPQIAPDGSAAGDLCWPSCVTDNDCAGRKCNLRSGLCDDTPSTGEPVGAVCDPTASSDPCAGFCFGFSATDPTVGQCSSDCNPTSLGVTGGCGSDPQQGSPQQAACVDNTTYVNGATSGACARLCNCDGDCGGPSMLCESWQDAGFSNSGHFATLFQKQGICVFAAQTSGSVGIPCAQDGGVE